MEKLYNYVLNEFIPRYIKRREINDIYDSDTIEYFYIDILDINNTFLNSYYKNCVINIIENQNIKIENSNSENIYKPNKRKYDINISVNDLNKKFKEMNSFKYKSIEYINKRNEIFKIYMQYANHIGHKYIDKYDVSYEDILENIYLCIIEAIEKYNYKLPFSIFLNNYITYKLTDKYRLNGIGINLYNKSCTNDIDEITKSQNIKDAFNIKRMDEDIFDLNLLDNYSSLDRYIKLQDNKEFKDIIVDLIMNLESVPSAKHRAPKNIYNYKRLLVIYYGLNGGKKLTIKETARIFNQKTKWVSDNLTIAREILAEAVLRYNLSATEEEKIYVY